MNLLVDNNSPYLEFEAQLERSSSSTTSVGASVAAASDAPGRATGALSDLVNAESAGSSYSDYYIPFKELRLKPDPATSAQVTVAKSDVEQGDLVLTSEFDPSMRLLELWVQGLNLLQADIDGDIGEFALEVHPVADRELLAEQFRVMLFDLIGRFAIRKAVQDSTCLLTFGGSFGPHLQRVIISHIVIEPIRSKEFFEILYRDLARWLFSVDYFERPWGKLSLKDGPDQTIAGIYKRDIVLTPRRLTKARKPKGFERAKIV